MPTPNLVMTMPTVHTQSVLWLVTTDVGNQIGVAPESQWIGCRNMDAGNGRPQTYMACFEFFLAPHAHWRQPHVGWKVLSWLLT